MKESDARDYYEKYKNKFSKAMIEKQLLNYGATKEQIKRLFEENKNHPIKKTTVKKDLEISPIQNELELANIWARLLAFILDFMIFYLGMIIIITPFMLDPKNSNLAFLLAGPIFLILGLLLYYPLMQSSKKEASLGKVILNLKVVDYSKNKITIGKGFLRFLIKFATGILSLGLVFIVILFTKNKQSIHDFATKTYVMSSQKPSASTLTFTIGIIAFLLIALSYITYIGYEIVWSYFVV